MKRRIVQLAVAFGVLAGAAAAVSASGPSITAPAACCAPAVRLTPPVTLPPSNSVVVTGDSLTWGIVTPRVLGSADTIQARLEATGRSVFTAAEIGRSTPWGVGIVRSNPSVIRAADVIVVGFGTNEVLDTPGLGVGESRAAIDKMIAAIRGQNGAARIVWIDVSVERLATRTANWNQALADAEASTAGLHVCRWRSTAISTPSTFARDGVHLTDAGYRARRDIAIACIIGRAG